MKGYKLGAICFAEGYTYLKNLFRERELYVGDERYDNGITNADSHFLIFDKAGFNQPKVETMLSSFKVMVDKLSTILPFFSVFNTSLIKPKKDNWQNLLTNEELKILDNYNSDKSKLEFIAGRALLKMLITAHHSGIDKNDLSTENLAIKKDDKGKPDIIVDNKNHQGYTVCISHKDDYIFCGFHPNKKFGLDVEKIDPRLHKVRKYFMDESENLIVKSYSQNDIQYLESLAKIWASKESLVKYNADKLLKTTANTKLRSINEEVCKFNLVKNTNETENTFVINSYSYSFDEHIFTVVI